MIFLHRQNEFYTELPCEVDVRSSPNGLVLNHDPLDFEKQYPLLSNRVFTAPVIFNVKESGVEEQIIEMMQDKEFYFLDSQIPDIVRLKKLYPNHAHRFIIRVSLNEPPSILIGDAKYVWIDYDFNKFDIIKYHEFINFVMPELGNAKPIFVSPELYGKDFLQYTPKVIKLIDSIMSHKYYSACTKHPELWEIK